MARMIQRRRLAALARLLATVLVMTGGPPVDAQTGGRLPATSYERAILPFPVNSRYHEVAPVIAPDGRTLFFHRFYHPDNIGGIGGGEDIWLAVLNPDWSWSNPANIGPPLNTAGNNFVTSVSPDGRTLYLGNVYRQDGTLAGGLSTSHKVGETWTLPKPVYIEGYRNVSSRSFFAVSADGKTMILEIENRESYGLDDLYVSQLNRDGSWSPPRNLGGVVNTPGREITPFLAPDGRTLYFSSNGRDGLGDQDVFVTRRLDSTWLEWSTPINLGPVVNTTGWDAYFTIPSTGEVAYLVSCDGGPTKSDIVRVVVPPEFRPDPTMIITGNVLDAATGERLCARVVIAAVPEPAYSTSEQSDSLAGQFTFVVRAGLNYLLHANRQGYVTIAESINLFDSLGSGEINVDLHLVPIRAGETFTMGMLYFDFGKAVIRPEAYVELDRLSELLNARPSMVLEIKGHTDSIGVDDPNFILSTDRGNSVRRYLLSKGVDSTQTFVTGRGRTQPRTNNQSSAGRQMNRRVEFTIVHD